MKPEVPKGWAVEPLGAVAEVLLSNVDKKSSSEEIPVKLCNYMDVYTNARITADLPFMEATATRAQVEKFGLRVGDVVITKDSEDPSDIAIPSVVVDEFNGSVVCGYHLAILRPRGVDGPYLSWMLRSRPINAQFTRRANGSTRFGLTNDVIQAAWIPLPPLPEQRKIAAILSGVDDAIAATQKVIEQTKRVKQGLLQTLMTRGIGHTRFKKTAIGEIPEAWDIRQLGDLASVERGRFTARPRNDPRYYGGDIPFVQTGDVTGADGELTSHSQTLNEEGLAVSRLFPKGTLLITIAANIGDVAEATYSVAFPDSVVGIQAGTGVDARWLLYMLGTRRQYLNKVATQNAQKNINLQILRPLPIPLPHLAEQREIARRLDAVSESRSRSEASLASLQSLKHGLMQDLLSGRVRVQPD